MQQSLIDLLIKKLIDLKIAKPDEILGCSSMEIVELQKRQGVVFIPEIYQEFLLKMGKGAGNFLQHLECFYPELLHLKDEVKTEILREDRTTFRLPNDAFVFMANQAYEFFYFQAKGGENDPPVYHYIEGDGSSRNVNPIKQWERLSEYFQWELDNIRQASNLLNSKSIGIFMKDDVEDQNGEARFHHIINQLPSVDFVEFQNIDYELIKYHLSNDKLISKHQEGSTVISWITSLLKENNVHGEYFLMFEDKLNGKRSQVPWALVRLGLGYEWVSVLWNLGEGLYFISPDMKTFLQVIHQEDFFEAYLTVRGSG